MFLPSRSHGFDSRLPLHLAPNVTTYVRSERPPTGEALLVRQVIWARFKVGTELAEFEVESLRALVEPQRDLT